MLSNKEALERLALNPTALAELNRRQSEINIFEILQVHKTEIRHSNILAWLLDPQESHGLGESFLRGFIKAVIINLKDRDDEKDYCIIDSNENDGISNDILNDLDWWIAADFYKVKVDREHDHIDIIVSGKGRISGEGDDGKAGFLIAIENKVGAEESETEGKYQTESYFEKLMDPDAKREDGTNYNEFKKRMYVFLTPDGTFAKDPHWAMLTYDDIVEILESALNENEIPQISALVIGDYIKTIKKHITGDSELIEICDKLLCEDQSDALSIILKARKRKYEAKDDEKRLLTAITNKYEKAIEAIESNHSDVSYLVGQYIRETLRSIKREKGYEIELPDKFNQKAYIRFTTSKMTELLGGQLDDSESPWKTRDKYYYQFDNRAQGRDKTKVSFYLVLGGGDFLQRESLLDTELRIAEMFGARSNEDYKYKRCAIPNRSNRKKNYKWFYLKDRDTLQAEVEQYVREMIDEAINAENRIEKMLERSPKSD